MRKEKGLPILVELLRMEVSSDLQYCKIKNTFFGKRIKKHTIIFNRSSENVGSI